MEKGPSVASVDQSAITGESLAVDKFVGDVAYYTCGVKRGKVYAVVVASAPLSFVGRTASLVMCMYMFVLWTHACPCAGDVDLCVSFQRARTFPDRAGRHWHSAARHRHRLHLHCLDRWVLQVCVFVSSPARDS